MQTVMQVTVTESDLDILGHMNHVKYLEYMREARGEWYSQAGLSRELFAEKQMGSAVKRIDIQFFKEARLGDTLQIITSPLRLGTTSFVFKQVINNQEEVPIAEAEVIMAVFHLVERKSVRVPVEFARHF